MTRMMAGTHSVMMIMIKMIKKTICYHLNNKMSRKNCLNFKITIQKTKKTKMKLINQSLSTTLNLKMRSKTKTKMKRSLSKMIKTRTKTRMKK